MKRNKSSPFYSIFLTAIECELANRKHDCLIRSTDGVFRNFLQLCETWRAQPEIPTLRVGYLPAPQIRTLIESRPNAVLVDHTGDPSLRIPYASVGFDNAEAARLMVGHLLENGRT